MARILAINSLNRLCQRDRLNTGSWQVSLCSSKYTMPTATARYTSNSSISLKQFQMRLQSVAGYVVQAGYCQIRIYWASGCLLSLVAHLECSLIQEHKVKIPARTAAPYATASFGLICSGALLDELVHVWDLWAPRTQVPQFVSP